MGTLYLVATPIGNLEDITLRALRILNQVSLIAAEDTRHTQKLLDHYSIKTNTISYHEHNKLARLDKILSALAAGDVALVSDAGMPAINDPGFELVQAAIESGYVVSPIPGPSAPLAALAASGLPTDTFVYLGYLPRKSKDRQRLLRQISELPYTLIFLETPHRLTAALEDLLEGLGDRQASIARELTKVHEEILHTSLSQSLSHFRSQEPRGEFTIIISGAVVSVEQWGEERILAAIEHALELQKPASQAAREIAQASGWPKSHVYNLLRELVDSR